MRDCTRTQIHTCTSLMERTKNGSPFKLFGLFHREDRWSSWGMLFLSSSSDKIRCTYFGPKTFRGCCILIYLLTYLQHYIAWTIFLVTWGVITKGLFIAHPSTPVATYVAINDVITNMHYTEDSTLGAVQEIFALSCLRRSIELYLQEYEL